MDQSQSNIDTLSHAWFTGSRASGDRGVIKETLDRESISSQNTKMDQSHSRSESPRDCSVYSDHSGTSERKTSNGINAPQVCKSHQLRKRNARHYIEQFHTDKKSRPGIVFFHGFPADSGKNEDVAKKICTLLEMDVFLPHYAGLGKSEGTFSFERSVLDSVSFVKDLKNSYSEIHLVGHSWGGLVALNVLNQIPDCLGNLALLAPLTKLTDSSDEITSVLKWFIESRLALHRTDVYSLETLEKDYELTRERYSPIGLLETLKPKLAKRRVRIMQGEKDEVVATKDTIAWAENTDGLVSLEIVPDDHWFTEDRERVISFVAKSIP